MYVVWLDISFLEIEVWIPLSYLIKLNLNESRNTLVHPFPSESWYPDDVILGVIDDMGLTEVLHASSVSEDSGHASTNHGLKRPWF